MSEEQTLFTSDSCIAHCLVPMGLLNRQKNQGMEEEQEMVRLDPSGVMVPGGGRVETMYMDRVITAWKLSKNTTHVFILK